MTLRQLFYCGEALLDRLRRAPTDVARDCETLYAARADPWNYASQEQQDRFRQALALIRQHRCKGEGLNILELGCGEGEFSVLIAPSASQMLCLDRSATALARAGDRLKSQPRVELRGFDVLQDRIDRSFDLVIADHLIDLFHRPAAYQAVAHTIAAALAPGGIALVGVMRGSALVEAAWWSRPLTRGGLAILDWARRHSEFRQLHHVERLVGPFYIYDVYRRPC